MTDATNLFKTLSFEQIAPPMNHITTIGAGVYRVCYQNPGQKRISLELVAAYDRNAKRFQLVGGQVMDIPTFDAYRRQTWPMEHEKKRNPKNVTLGVHSGSAPSQSNS